ncbi:hypothetical protein ACT7C6_10150 [Bacillus paranthracis]
MKKTEKYFQGIKSNSKYCYEYKKDEHKKSHDCCTSHKKKNNCCTEQKVERQVNNPTNDVINFPRITQSETSLAYFNKSILFGYNNFNNGRPEDRFKPGTYSLSAFSFSNDLGNTWIDGGTIPLNGTGFNDGDPVVAVDRNGIFYYGQIGREEVEGTLQGVISVSTGIPNPTGTITMHPPQVVGRGQNPSPEPGSQDKEWIAVGGDANNLGMKHYILHGQILLLLRGIFFFRNIQQVSI